MNSQELIKRWLPQQLGYYGAFFYEKKIYTLEAYFINTVAYVQSDWAWPDRIIKSLSTILMKYND